MDFSFGTTISLLVRTLPFIVLRLIVYLTITVAYVVAVGVGGGIGFLFGKVGGASPAGTFWGAAVGFAIVTGILFWAREYLLYLVKAGHIAVLAELIDGREIPGGRGQIDYATSKVKERFTESSVLFGIDVLIKGILRVFNSATMTIANMIPLPGLDGLVKIVNAIVNTSLTFLDEVILAQIFRLRSTNPWSTARDGVVLYAQNFKAILKNAVFLTVIVWGMTLLIFLIVIGPIAALVHFFPSIAGFWTFVLAVVVALSLKAALIDPFAMTALMQVYFKLVQGQTPNAEWTARLNGMSAKFRELEAKAGGPSPAPAGASPAGSSGMPPPPPPR